ARDKSRLYKTQKQLQKRGVKVVMVSADVANYQELKDAADIIIDQLGHIDIWVNNAMASVLASFPQIEPEEFQRVTDVTYHGYVWGTRIALEHMIPRNSGSVVQIGSALAFRGMPVQSAYSGAKHAIQGFSESVRTELMHANFDISI